MQVSSSRSFLHPTRFNVDNSRTNFSEQTGRPHLEWHTTFCSNGNSPISHCSCWEFPESPRAVGKPQDCLVFRACSEWHPCKTNKVWDVCSIQDENCCTSAGITNPSLGVWSKRRETPASRTQQAAWRIIFISSAQRMLFCLAFPAWLVLFLTTKLCLY